MTADELQRQMEKLPTGSIILVLGEHPSDTELSIVKIDNGTWTYVRTAPQHQVVSIKRWAEVVSYREFTYVIY